MRCAFPTKKRRINNKIRLPYDSLWRIVCFEFIVLFESINMKIFVWLRQPLWGFKFRIFEILIEILIYVGGIWLFPGSYQVLQCLHITGQSQVQIGSRLQHFCRWSCFHRFNHFTHEYFFQRLDVPFKQKWHLCQRISHQVVRSHSSECK